MADLSTQIEQAAALHQESVSGAKQVTERPISELIAADQYLAEKAARGKSRVPVRIAKIRPGGAC
jgi:hypothetical protein